MKKYRLLTILILTLATLPSFGEDINKAEKAINMTGEELLLLIYGIIAVGVALIALLFCVYFIYVLNISLNPPAASSKPAFSLAVWLNEKFGAGKLKPIEEEGDISLGHSYDGIMELDNGMPPWLKYLFSGTVVFAIVYLFNYLILNTGLTQTQEYDQEIAMAGKEAAARKLLAANSLDESNVTPIKDKAQIAEGKTLFDQNCKACHGALGEGGVGPNLTDEYWIHGGKINDIFKTIKYGVPEKGMISWQAKFKPLEIQKVSSFIMTLKGTNPANGKAPQGDVLPGEKTVSVAQ